MSLWHRTLSLSCLLNLIWVSYVWNNDNLFLECYNNALWAFICVCVKWYLYYYTKTLSFKLVIVWNWHLSLYHVPSSAQVKHKHTAADVTVSSCNKYLKRKHRQYLTCCSHSKPEIQKIIFQIFICQEITSGNKKLWQW